MISTASRASRMDFERAVAEWCIFGAAMLFTWLLTIVVYLSAIILFVGVVIAAAFSFVLKRLYAGVRGAWRWVIYTPDKVWQGVKPFLYSDAARSLMLGSMAGLVEAVVIAVVLVLAFFL